MMTAAGARLVLVVDDDPLVGRTLAREFRRLGFEAQTATCYDEAIAAVTTTVPDLIVLDLYLGKQSGIDLLPVLKQHAPDADVVLISGYASLPTVVDALRQGARSVLTKPVAATAILEELSRCKAPPSGKLKPPTKEDPGCMSLVEALELKNAELVELHRFKDEMTTFIVHDLKNPVAVLTANLDYVSKEMGVQTDPEITDAINSSQIATLRILGLATNILDLIRLESSAMSLQRCPIQVEPLLTKMMSTRCAHLTSRQVTVSVSVEEAPLAVEWDVGLIMRMIENIVDNAVRHAGNGGRIEITANRVGENVRIRIGNTGPPIPVEARPLVFEKFRQAAAVHAGKSNFGLGLYFCRLAAEAHGGRIWVEETPTLPTVFVVEMPARG